MKKTIVLSALSTLCALVTTSATADEKINCTSTDNGTSPCNLYCGANTTASPPACYSAILNGPCDNYLYTNGTDFVLGSTYTVPYTYTYNSYSYDSATDSCNTSDVISSVTSSGSCSDYDTQECPG